MHNAADLVRLDYSLRSQTQPDQLIQVKSLISVFLTNNLVTF